MEKLDKVIEKNPFSTYDLFGYLLPSIAFLSLSGLIETIIADEQKEYLLLRKIMTILVLNFDKSKFIDGFMLVIIGFVSLYIIGHLIATISSIVLDRVLVYRGYGYPMARILGLKLNQNDIFNRHTVRFYFIYINLSLLVFITNKLFKVQFCEYLFHSMFGALSLIIISTVIIIILSIVEKSTKKMKTFLDKSVYFLHKIVDWLLFPFLRVEDYLSGVFQLAKSIEESEKKKFEENYYNIFQIESNVVSNSSLFWSCYNYVMSYKGIIARNVDNWFYLYSFMRNLSTAFYLSFIYGLMHLFLINQFPVSVIYLLIVIQLLSFVFMFRYYYLYAGYFSKYIIRSFIHLVPKEDKVK